MAATLDELVVENQKLLEGFASDGVDLNQEFQFVFRVVLPSKHAARQFRTYIREHAETLFLGSRFELMLVADYRDFAELHIEFNMKAEPKLVSQVEYALHRESRAFGGEDVDWEFNKAQSA